MIQFTAKEKEKRFYEVLKSRVAHYFKSNQLSKTGNLGLYLKGLLFLGLYLGSYALLILGDLEGGAIVLLYTSMGITGLLVAFNISHDACHDALFKSRFWNNVVYSITFNMLGTNAYLWKMRHISSHHPFPNVDGCDADIDNNRVIRLSPHAPVYWYHAYQHWYAPLVYSIYTLHWVFYKDFHYLRRKHLANMHNIKHPPLAVWGVFLAKILYLTYLVIIPLLLMPEKWAYLLLGFLTLHLVMSYFFLFTNIMNHYSDGVAFPLRNAEDGNLPHHWAVHQVITCLDFYPESQFVNFFFGGFNAHCAHHLFPHVAHHHYGAISRIIEQTTNEFKIPYRKTTWWKGLKAHFRYLKQLGRV